MDTEKISVNCQKLMFMLAACSAGAFATVPNDQKIILAAYFDLTPEQLIEAADEFAKISVAVSAARKDALAKLRAAMN
jgi:hypothetical protein